MRPVRAVTVDLDDTLFPQAAFLDGAWRTVAAAGASVGVDRDRLLSELQRTCAEGSDRGRIIDRALDRLGAPSQLAPRLVAAFHAHAPGSLPCYPGAADALSRLRAVVPVACVTDGAPAVQRAKLRALGLVDAFDAVVISDELGRGMRKPHPAPFQRALSALGVAPEFAVHVGDRPDKDVAGANAAGMRAIRVCTGEYRRALARPGAEPMATVPTVVAALELLICSLPAERVSAGGAR
jgi:putative hydrolase of the HAD superfamily